MRNKEQQEFLVPVSQWLRQWRGREMLADSTAEAKTSNPVAPTPEFEGELIIQPDEVSPRWFKPKIALGGWTIFWLSLIGIMGTTSMAGYWLLMSPPSMADCSRNQLIVSAGEKLYCAYQKAQSGKLQDVQAGMAIARSFTPEQPLYNEAQRLMGEWSLDLLRLAQEKVNKGDLQGGRAIVKQIPTTSTSYETAIQRTKRWQKQWQFGNEVEKEFQSAIKVQNWQKARGNAEKLYDASSDYWRIQARDRLLSQLNMEKDGWQLLKDAKKMARYRGIDDISRALALSNRIKPKTNARALAKTEMNLWSQAILKEVAKEYRQQDFNKAIALAKLVPKDVAVGGLAQDWMALSQASQKAGSQKDADLSKAVTVLKQIRPQSPLYKQAQAKISLWKKQLHG